MVHLFAELEEVIAWADENDQPCAFTDINAASRAADFYHNVGGAWTASTGTRSAPITGGPTETTRWRNFWCTVNSRGT